MRWHQTLNICQGPHRYNNQKDTHKQFPRQFKNLENCQSKQDNQGNQQEHNCQDIQRSFNASRNGKYIEKQD